MSNLTALLSREPLPRPAQNNNPDRDCATVRIYIALAGPPGDTYAAAGTPAFLGAATPYGDGTTPALDGATPGSAAGGGAGGAYSPALPSPAAGTPGLAPTPGTPGFDPQSPGLPSGAARPPRVLVAPLHAWGGGSLLLRRASAPEVPPLTGLARPANAQTRRA